MKFTMKIFAAGVAALVLFGSVAGCGGGDDEKWRPAKASKPTYAKSDPTDWSPQERLVRAAKRDDYAEAQEAIRLGADINAKDYEGKSLLYLATRANSVNVAKLLISKGADVNAKDNGNHVPLHQAARHNAVSVAKLLISKGANVNAITTYSTTPLHTAAYKNSVDVARLLVGKGANVNVKNNAGRTPLSEAQEHGSSEVAKVISAHIAAEAAATKQAAAKKAAADKKIAAELESANIAYKVGNYEAAFPLYKSLAEGGSEYAQGKLAVMYEKGQGTAIDTAEAKKWYQRIIENEAGKPAVVAWAKERFYSLP